MIEFSKNMGYVLKTIWTDCETPFQYFTAVWIYFLMTLAFTGIGKMFFELVTNPSQFDNAQFGIFDYCC
tara:strand:+ start:162 stop:368 length:207 start_codon:yes stop_codon:yes gene_type:complete